MHKVVTIFAFNCGNISQVNPFGLLVQNFYCTKHNTWIVSCSVPDVFFYFRRNEARLFIMSVIAGYVSSESKY